MIFQILNENDVAIAQVKFDNNAKAQEWFKEWTKIHNLPLQWSAVLLSDDNAIIQSHNLSKQYWGQKHLEKNKTWRTAPQLKGKLDNPVNFSNYRQKLKENEEWFYDDKGTFWYDYESVLQEQLVRIQKLRRLANRKNAVQNGKS